MGAVALVVMPAVSGATQAPPSPAGTPPAATYVERDRFDGMTTVGGSVGPSERVEPDMTPILQMARAVLIASRYAKETYVPVLVAELGDVPTEAEARVAATPAPGAATASSTPAPRSPAPTAPRSSAPPPTATPVPAPAAAPTPVATATPTPAPPTPAPATSASAVSAGALNARAAGLFHAMNGERSGEGLSPLRLHAGLSAIAEARARDMQERSYFAHVSPTGESWLTLLNRSGLQAGSGGENLARLSGDVERSVTVAITKLMESPTHRANIMHTRYTDVGVAALTDGDGVTIFVTVFTGP